MYSLLHHGPASCKNCKYYRRIEASEEAGVEIEVEEFSDVEVECGRCVRHPPTFFHQALLNAEFPVVQGSMWCGEFKRDIE